MGRRSKYLPPKTDEQLRAERKARRERRNLWKTNPTEARRIENQEWDERDARNQKVIGEWRARKDIVKALFPKYISFELFKCPNKYHQEQEGGRLICKVCGKVYQWTEWGRYETLGITNMAEHLMEAHPTDFKKVGCVIRPKIELQEWLEELYKKMKKEGKM